MTGDPSSGGELVAVLAALANPIRWRIIGAHGRDYVSHLAREVVPEEVQALKSPPGRHHRRRWADRRDVPAARPGGRAHHLRAPGGIYVHPVVLGDGKALFPASAQQLPLRLIETRSFGNGVVLLRYAVG